MIASSKSDRKLLYYEIKMKKLQFSVVNFWQQFEVNGIAEEKKNIVFELCFSMQFLLWNIVIMTSFKIMKNYLNLLNSVLACVASKKRN